MLPGPCMFCEIAAGRTSAHRVHEDDQVFAILTLEQPTPHKVIAVPRACVQDNYELTGDLAAAVMRATVKVTRTVHDASGFQGLKLLQANGRIGQQDILHFQLHIVPRWTGDGIVLNWDNTRAPEEDLARYAAHLRTALETYLVSRT
jgi:histidine triad (HIT) family protein